MPTTTLLVLGADGDLTKRLLLPGLGTLLALEDHDLELVGTGLTPRSDEEWRELVSTALADVPADRRDRILSTSRYSVTDVTEGQQLQELLDSCSGVPVLYFALPPAVTARVCALLEHVRYPDGIRLALEKPFGSDRETARKLNELLGRVVPERQIYRIDHFLGMSTVLNLLGLRFANRLIEPSWHSGAIQRVEILYDETLGLEGRGGYYDRAGALIDMIQSHLLEVLALVAMEPIDRVDEVALRDAIAEVLRRTRVRADDPVASSRRARYSAGTVGDRRMPSYADEKGVDPALNTETLAQVTLEVDTDRWRGVPFVLRSGKALGAVRKEAHAIFHAADALPGLQGVPQSDSITLGFKSGEVRLELTMNGGGDPFHLEQAVLEVQQAPSPLQPYGEVLRGILTDDPVLSVRGDIAEECWRIVEPVLTAWKENRVPLEEYPAGSSGPEGW